MLKYLTLGLSFAMILSMTNPNQTQTNTQVFDQDQLTAADLAPYNQDTDMGGRQLPDAEVFDFAAAQQARMAKVPDSATVKRILTGSAADGKTTSLGLPELDTSTYEEEPGFKLSRPAKAAMLGVGFFAAYLATNGFKTPAQNADMVSDWVINHLPKR